MRTDKKAILRLSAYYKPERYAGLHLTEDLENALAKENYEINVFAPTPTRGVTKETRKKYQKIKYEERLDGAIKVNRFPLVREKRNPIVRAVRYILGNIKQYRIGVRVKNVDVVFCDSTPPTQGLLCAKVAKRLSKKYKKKVPFVFNLQDVFPDSLVYTGLSKKDSIFWKIGRKIEDYTYKNADKIIVITESFKENIMAKGVPEDKIVVVPNWVDTEKIKPIEKTGNGLMEELNISPDKFIVVYAGNFGAAQGADIVIKVAEKLQDYKQIQFVIFGGGAEFENAKDYVRQKELENIVIQPLLPQERVPEVYSLGDIALITCKAGAGQSGMPSKTWSIMACNTPIVASFDTDSELARLLKEEKLGECVEPENVEELAAAIKARYERYSQGNKEEKRAREFVEKYASKDICVAEYIKVFNTII